MASQKRVGVVLSGCGFLDGAEIHEAVCTLLSLDRRGVKLVATAPDVEQLHVVDHVKGAPADGERRRVLVEAARIVRGQITPLSAVSGRDLDALVFPGGFGAAKNLCSFAVEGRAMRVLPEVERIVREVRGAGRPMGFICIAPVIAARLLGPEGVKVTIGNDRDTAAAIESWGARHVDCKVEDAVVDERLKIASTPAYMLGPWIAPVATGIDKLVSAVLEMA
ncbi:ThiJ/PfpI domain protein [Anaeromyxobacter dehalogenans 2CP-1]|uniref:ThiJ/PfpI domain protein n=1 Tax=Anaeromyxobacter dehalogenans (strain ATCC BAA-258 / DSM 21875 / 2CP-1) TaxID=455488 RepID=B8JA69_ANAD2|nr:isoprenoid biosynthesis glyoxalase ElbB [Anaeromyxobacter dehalogenans]ACL65588.1 ThiJ/PfpI domain protein [Anaeromyxobacter dehalogenans 2CP-1]